MNLDGLSICILSCLDKIGVNRTTTATFYILKGKKSSQTMQDIHLFKLTSFFYLFPDLQKSNYEWYLQNLYKEGFVQFQHENSVSITKKGIDRLQKENLPYINGYKYGKISQIFWRRVLLIVQTTSNLIKNNNRFRPIILEEDVHLFVKGYLLNIPFTREQLSNQLYEECISFLYTRTKEECDIFVWKLTGKDRISLTNKQIANKLGIQEWDVYLIFQAMIHHLLSKIEEFPILQSICPNIEMTQLGDSTRRTYSFIQKNKTIDEIVTLRNLKRSTVEDHIIEIARSNPNFLIDTFITVDKRKKIEEIYMQKSTKKLKELKQYVGESISYFEIRLVLTRIEQ